MFIQALRALGTDNMRMVSRSISISFILSIGISNIQALAGEKQFTTRLYALRCPAYLQGSWYIEVWPFNVPWVEYISGYRVKKGRGRAMIVVVQLCFERCYCESFEACPRLLDPEIVNLSSSSL